MEWKIVFDVDLAATYSLYLPQISFFLSLLVSHLLLGSALWFIVNCYIQTHNGLQFSYVKDVKILVSGLILTYFLIAVFYHLPQPYKNLSSNMVLTYFPEIVMHYWTKTVLTAFYMDESTFNTISRVIRAPAVDISRPTVILKEPIKHVFIIILESIRADALPLNENLAKAVQSSFTPDATAANVTPLLNSLWMNSVRTVASATSSYTLKSLLSIFCGIYPLNINFLAEASPENLFYEKCLPDLLRETFRMTNNQSAFRSAFFTAARDDFDHQKDLFEKLRFDTVNNGFDIYKEVGNIPDLGGFGPADPNILPLLWKWIDNNLAKDKTSQLMMSLLTTGTHVPFAIPNDRPPDEYRDYIHEGNVNSYLNAIRVSDDLLKTIIDGFKSRKLYNETLFVIVSDHGYSFNDYGKETVGLLHNPRECAFSVPLMLHNPYLEAQQLLNDQFTTMDVLPTIMDVLLSSIGSSKQSSNRLLSVPNSQLHLILSRYEGTSMLRKPVEQQPVRYTFHLANPGSTYIIIKQYPRKFTYDIVYDEVHLYHLAYDPFELVDLITLSYDTTDTPPLWIDTVRGNQSLPTWKGRWSSEKAGTNAFSQLLSQNISVLSTSESKTMNSSKVQLNDMLNWADQAFELARLWDMLVKQRYHYRNRTANN